MKIVEFNSSNMGHEYDQGKESIVYDYKEDGEDVLIKLYRDNIVLEEEANNVPFRHNKEQKLRILSSTKDNALVTVRNLVYKNGKLIGFTMDKIEGTHISYHAPKQKRIAFLNQIRENMLRLNEKGIYIGDFDDRNFVIDSTGKVIHIDIDNYKIGGYDIDVKDEEIKRFDRSKARKELLDRYYYNYYALALMGKYALGYCNIHTMKLPLSMRTFHNYEVLDEMRCLNENYSGKLFTLTRKDEDN